MEYKEFLTVKEEILRDPHIVNAAETDLSSAFPPIDAPNGVLTQDGERINRAQIVQDFIQFTDTPEVYREDISLSEGVLHSLDVLLDLYHQYHWLIPEDICPEYVFSAKNKNADYDTYQTFNNPTATIEGSLRNKIDILLITCPLKPMQDTYYAEELLAIRNWLEGSKARKVVVDAVYALDFASTPILDLYEDFKDQVIVLYSLAKSFAAPGVTGFIFTRAPEVHAAMEIVPINKHRLRTAHYLLASDYGWNRHSQVKRFVARQAKKAETLGLVPLTDGTTYLFLQEGTWEAVLAGKGILVLPSSTFGSYNSQKYIISTLGL